MPKKRRTTLGDAIRAQRQQLGLTQQEVADRLGLTQAAVSQWELNRATPTLPTLRGIGEALGLDLADLTELAAPAGAR